MPGGPWWEQVYGDPCRGCGTTWVVPVDRAVADVAAVPDQLRRELDRIDGDARHPDLGWSAVGYVVHVADTLRVWSERLAGAVAGDRTPVAGFDGDELARVRRYAGFGPGAAVWTLDRAVRDWCEVVPLAERSDVSLEHPTRGTLSVQDVVLRSRHGALHHVWDVRRTVGHRLG